jgi:hypothetical protein
MVPGIGSAFEVLLGGFGVNEELKSPCARGAIVKVLCLAPAPTISIHAFRVLPLPFPFASRPLTPSCPYHLLMPFGRGPNQLFL